MYCENNLKKLFIGCALGLAVVCIPLTSHGDVTQAASSQLTLVKAGDDTLAKTSAAFNQVAKKATPSVVSIRAVKYLAAKDLPPGHVPFPFDAPAQHNGQSGEGEPQASLGIGSGVIIRSDGLILTNNHVVEGAERITVAIDETQKYKAKVIGTDSKTDIALIKIEEPPKNLVPISFANSDQVEVGDWAIAIGSPFGLTHTVTSGIISAKGRGQLGVYDVEDFLQTDAAINPGNSGGPLLNMKGEMIGLNAAIFSQSGGFIGIGFSISSNLAKKVADEISSHGRVVRGWIGLIAQDMDKDLAKYFKSPEEKGALISYVNPKGPAGTSTLQAGDVVVKYNGTSVPNSNQFKALVSLTKPGSKADLEVFRTGALKHVDVKILETPADLAPSTQQAGQVASLHPQKKSMGLVLEEIPDDLTKLVGVQHGEGALVVGVKPGGPAFEAGMAPGDVILKANSVKVRNPGDLAAFSKHLKSDELAILYVQRGPDRRVYIPLKLEE